MHVREANKRNYIFKGYLKMKDSQLYADVLVVVCAVAVVGSFWFAAWLY